MREFGGVEKNWNPASAATEGIVRVIPLVSGENDSTHPMPIAFSYGLRSAVSGIVSTLIKPMVRH